MLLEASPKGLCNAQISNQLGLISAIRGYRRNYLTYSDLGELMACRLVIQNQETKNPPKHAP